MARPGLLRLLADIREKLIEVVVVYKVDRLTRSLAETLLPDPGDPEQRRRLIERIGGRV